MRISNGVLNLVRGVGGAAVIAVSLAGCGASGSSSRELTMAEKPASDVVQTEVSQTDDESFTDDEVSPQVDYDIPRPCGRG